MRYLVLLTVMLMAATHHAQQTIQLLSEDFNGVGNLFQLNTTSLGAPYGNNSWIVNNHYSGAPNYPNTPSQNGTGYLHIHDQADPSQNANWDPSSWSDNFLELVSGFCTKSLTDVKVTFSWLCEGNTNSFGSFYYSLDGGSWVKAGQTKYNNQGAWTAELIQDSAWEDQANVRIGFRWLNQFGGTTNSSFAIDNIVVVGTYDNVNNPVTLNITVSPDSVCPGDNVIVFYSISDTLCPGQYRFELSDASGSFVSPLNLGFVNLGFTTNGAVAISMPANTAVGSCYRIRMVRTTPAPTIVGMGSTCIQVMSCPLDITTHRPAVTMGSGNGQGDSVCIRSVIDVPFNSGPGVFNSNNIYSAQLSDTNGNFTTPPAPFIIGSIPDQNNYPSIPPGNVAGIIPTVPEGCGYYVRVVSSSPAKVGLPWGPFCIKQCDILTNHIEDIHLCIDETDGDSTQICVDIHTWTANQQYLAGNQFTIEVHSSTTFTIVNVGGLGAIYDTVSGCFTIYAPPLPQLLAMGLEPGMYYIRIIATNGLEPHDLLGSFVRLTIGAPSESPPIISNPDSVICSDTMICFTVAPYNPNSTYEWQSPSLNGGSHFQWPGSTLCISFNGFQGTFIVRVREFNNGCYGPWSEYAELTVLGEPFAGITGPSEINANDQGTYYVPFADYNTYVWQGPGAIYTDSIASVFNVSWSDTGEYSISVEVANMCGSASGTKQITVNPPNTIQTVALSGFTLRPNPADESVMIEVGSELLKAPLELQISDMTGRVIQVIPLDSVSDQYVIGTTTLTSGLYSLSLRSNGYLVGTGRLVVVR